MVLDPLQTSNHNHSNKSQNIKSRSINPTSSLVKRSSSWLDPFSTHVDINSLVSYKKQKCLKFNISAPVQSYSHMSIDQTKGDNNYQSVYEEKLGNIIQSLFSTDETAAIVKHS